MNQVAAQNTAADKYVARCFVKYPAMKPCCVAGCFACCSEPVYATQAEVQHIIEILRPEQIAELKVKLPAWLEQTASLLNQKMPDAIAYRRLNVPCVLLNGGLGLCSVYERRPFGCRTWFALKKPADCDLPARKHQKYTNFMPGIAYATGVPVSLNGKVILDHLAILLAEKLLGLDIPSASRRTEETSKLKMPGLC
jgi:Fe-S-cluster containining protein